MDKKAELQGTDRHLGPSPGFQLSAQDDTGLPDCRVGHPELGRDLAISVAPHNPLQHGEFLVGEPEAILLPLWVVPHATSKPRVVVNE
jgi:hypothetical protein